MSKTTETGESHGGSSPPPRTSATAQNHGDSAAPHGAGGPESAPEVHGAAPALHARAELNEGADECIVCRGRFDATPADRLPLCPKCRAKSTREERNALSVRWLFDHPEFTPSGRPAAAPPAAAGSREPLAPSAPCGSRLFVERTTGGPLVCDRPRGHDRDCNQVGTGYQWSFDPARKVKPGFRIEAPPAAAGVPAYVEPERAGPVAAAPQRRAIDLCTCGHSRGSHGADGRCIFPASGSGPRIVVPQCTCPAWTPVPQPATIGAAWRAGEPVVVGVPVRAGDLPVLGATYLDASGEPYVLVAAEMVAGGVVQRYDRYAPGAIRVQLSVELWQREAVDKGHRYIGPRSPGEPAGIAAAVARSGDELPARAGDDDELEKLIQAQAAEWDRLPAELAASLDLAPLFEATIGDVADCDRVLRAIVLRCQRLSIAHGSALVAAVSGC